MDRLILSFVAALGARLGSPARRFIWALVIINTSLSRALPAAAQSGGEPGAFLQYGVGARALGMAGAFYAVADDASTAYWNPAGLAQLQRKEVTFMQSTLVSGAQFGYMGIAWPTATKGTFAIDRTALTLGGFEKVEAKFDGAGNPTKITPSGSFADTQSALGLSWGKEATDTVSFGLSLKMISRALESSSDNQKSLDIAALKTMGPSYRLAIGMQNVFSLSDGDTDDRFPVIIKVGNSLRMFKERLVMGFDLQKSQSSDLRWRFGGEYWAARWFATRFGILAAPQIQEADFGIGLKTRLFQLDIAQGIHGLGSTTRFSLSLRFGRSRDDRTDEQVKQIIEQGFEAFKEGNFQLATVRLTQAQDAQPHNKVVKSMLERLQRVVGFMPQAVGGEEFQTYVRKGVIAFVDGNDLKGSVNALRYAYNLNPKDDALLKLLNLAEREAETGEITRRIEGPETFTFVDQKLYDARQAIYDGKFDLAIRRTQDVIDLEPANVIALEIMGSAFFLMEEKDKARAVWKRVLEIDPKNKVVSDFIQQTQR